MNDYIGLVEALASLVVFIGSTCLAIKRVKRTKLRKVLLKRATYSPAYCDEIGAFLGVWFSPRGIANEYRTILEKEGRHGPISIQSKTLRLQWDLENLTLWSRLRSWFRDRNLRLESEMVANPNAHPSVLSLSMDTVTLFECPATDGSAEMKSTGT